MTRLQCATALLSSLLALGVTGCASSPPTFGEQLQSQGQDVARVGDQWVEGDEMVAEGRELIAEGDELIEKGEDLVGEGKDARRKGEQMVERGERMKREAREAYDRLNPAQVGS